MAVHGSGDNPFPLLFEKKMNTTFRSKPLTIVERGLDGTTTLRPLGRIVSVTYEQPWYIPCLEIFHYSFKLEKLVLIANREYIIPLSQGNFSLRMCRRI